MTNDEIAKSQYTGKNEGTNPVPFTNEGTARILRDLAREVTMDRQSVLFHALSTRQVVALDSAASVLQAKTD